MHVSDLNKNVTYILNISNTNNNYIFLNVKYEIIISVLTLNIVTLYIMNYHYTVPFFVGHIVMKQAFTLCSAFCFLYFVQNCLLHLLLIFTVMDYLHRFLLS